MIRLTYGFCSRELGRLIKKRVAPKLDQHAAHERNTRKNHICPRLGAAVDFIVEDENMREVADWIAENTPFDRLYFYVENRPIHVSSGPEQKGEYIDLVTSQSGRQVPRKRQYPAYPPRQTRLKPHFHIIDATNFLPSTVSIGTPLPKSSRHPCRLAP